MDSQSPITPKPQILDSAELFLTAHNSLSQQSLQPFQRPPSHSLLSNRSVLPPVPSNFPQSKLIPKTRFVVDGFRHAGDYSVSYFLSHFHSDHYTGLNPNWSRGIVFCSVVTARLLVEVLKVSSLFIVSLQLREPVVIDGCEVILIDANHCPGAVQFLFKVPCVDGKCKRYVHTGDFRFSNSMKLEHSLGEFVGSDAIFLDTTYCNPKFVFPSQKESVDYIVDVIQRIGGEYNYSLRNVLFLVSTYVVGKEKILLELSSRCKRKVYVDAKKMNVLRVLGYGESGVFTEDDSESDVHVVGWNVLGEAWPYFRPNFVRMKEIMTERGYTRAVGFVPTGWTYEVKRNKFAVSSKDSFQIHLVPYSEHSNYAELRELVKFLKPKRVVPTVGSDVEEVDSRHANKMRKHFSGLVDEMANKHEFLRGFHPESVEMDDKVVTDVSTNLKDEQNLETKLKSSEIKNVQSTDLCFDVDSSSSVQEPGSQDPALSSDEDRDKIIQELYQCLPTWVTRSQIVDLISSSGWNIVEAVSNFYECETEFHMQVFSCQTLVSTSQSQSCSVDNSLSLPKPSVVTKTPEKNVDICPTQDSKSPNLRYTVKSSTSAAKRKRNSVNKPNKKMKKNSKLESSGSKQPTITRFFGKLMSDVTQAAVGSKLEIIPKDESLLPSDASKLYKDEIHQFLQVINGNDTSIDYATNILEKTKGDINKALDMYYCNPDGLVGDRMKSDQAKCGIENTGKKKYVLENFVPDISPHVLSTENVDATVVCLPPEKYNPKEHAGWGDGQPAPYLHLARTFDLLEDEKGKIKATSMLCNMFRSLLALSPGDVLPAVYLCTNKIAADHENMELNIGGSLVSAALEEACGTNRLKIREMYNKLGDLGDVAQECRQTQRLLVPPSPLLIKDVFSALHKISLQTGNGSTVRKKSLIVNLMRSCREKEMKFLVRTLVRNLRIGAMMRTVLPSLAQAVVLHCSPNFHQAGSTENLKEKLQCLSAAVVDAYNILPSLDLVVPSIMNKGIEFSASSLSMAPGIPIKPTACKDLQRYDGQRAQIHKLVDGSICVFSRNGDETTSRFPDLIDIIKRSSKPAAMTFIVDAEVVAVDRKNGCKLMTFQELSSRGRGSKVSLVSAESIKVDICVFVFDIMFANGEQLLGFPLRQRRKYLKDLFADEKLGYFGYAKEMTVEADNACLTCESTSNKISSFLKDAIHSSCEGIMVKSLDVDAGYSPSRRTDTWLKIKRDYVDGLNDSLDLVPIGAWYGNGRKAGWYSPFLMACYNSDTEEYQSVCRVMSGFSDTFYVEMKELFSGDQILSKKPPYYQTAEAPDIWFCPKLVWEIRGSDFTISPVHHAAIGLAHPSRGISIRFPRFIRALPDRDPEHCSTAADIADMFHSQSRKMDVIAGD
ncbi:DNA ligase [Quillaja saponaria]|uniref:DNA ligase (ATP) n=1 Tax=Quillaja saponaria TaxID=32244 RepID=A0AAD7VH94_QUISA|nr:DNA ligase [Quillaja saponaria]